MLRRVTVATLMLIYPSPLLAINYSLFPRDDDDDNGGHGGNGDHGDRGGHGDHGDGPGGNQGHHEGQGGSPPNTERPKPLDNGENHPGSSNTPDSGQLPGENDPGSANTIDPGSQGPQTPAVETRTSSTPDTMLSPASNSKTPSSPTAITTTSTTLSAAAQNPSSINSGTVHPSQTTTPIATSSLRTPDLTPSLSTIKNTGSTSTRHTPPIGIIIGGVVGGLAFLVLLAGLGLLYYRRRRNRLAPSTAHRVASDRSGWVRIGDPVDNSNTLFRPDSKRNVGDNTAQDNNRQADLDVEAVLQRKAEIMDDLRFEAAVRSGVKA